MSSLFDWDRPRCWLFCFTHPDDELAIAASMRRLVQSGHEVHCSWTHTTEVRTREAIHAMELVGVGSDRMTFFDGTDGEVCNEMGRLAPKFRELLDSVRPDVVVTGAFEQGHLDHDSTSFLIHQHFDGEIIEFPLYFWYRWRSVQIINRFSSPSDQQVIDLTKDEIRFKVEMARRYPSQTIYNALTLNHLKDLITFSRPRTVERELVRISPRPDFGKPNHHEALGRKIARSPRWKKWERALEQMRLEG